MEMRYTISQSVRIAPVGASAFRVGNGHDFDMILGRDAVHLLQLFQEPMGVEELGERLGDDELIRHFVQTMADKLILTPVNTTPTEDMRRTWNYLSSGSLERALRFIDNDSKTLTDFERSGREAVTALNRLIPIAREARVLTIGCGMGRLEHALSSQVGRIDAFDISENMVTLARTYLNDCPNIRIGTTKGLLDGITSESVDLVFSFLVFQHITRGSLWTYFLEARRVLKQDGRFLFQIHLYDDLQDDIETTSLVERYYGAGKARFNEQEIRARLSASGFELEWLREGRRDTEERRLVGTSDSWRSVLVCCRLGEQFV